MDEQIINGGDIFRDASFSYLRSEQTQTQTQTPKTTATRTSFGLDRKKADHEGEISVFGAERYFNAVLVEDHHHYHHHDHRDRRSGSGKKLGAYDDHQSRPGTPSACSDTSWASKSSALLLKAASSGSGGLIRNPSRKYQNRKRKIINGSKSLFATLGCTGTCTDEKSVHVGNHNNDVGHGNNNDVNNHHHDHDHDHHHRLRYEARSTKRSEEHFAFPILSAASEDQKKPSSGEENEKEKLKVGASAAADEPPRMSLEVFGSKMAGKPGNVLDEVAINLERKLSVLTWDAIPAKPYSVSSRVSPKAGRPGHEDMDSDASSDLFEIENITAGTRRASEESTLSRCGGGEYNYEPSEASIEWSVVTASAAPDLGLEYDEKKLAAAGNARPPSGQKAAAAARRRAGGGMLGCKSEKSVSVAEAVHKASVGGVNNKESKAISSPNV